MSKEVRVLIVEDEWVVSLDLEMKIQRLGYQVSGQADSFDTALEFFKEATPDIVLMDVNIKGEKSGIDLTHAIKKIKDVPVVFISAFSSKEMQLKMMEVGGEGLLMKPFNDIDLKSAIEKAIG